jgi:3-oxoacyl-[acyl-carrier protein] reductase
LEFRRRALVTGAAAGLAAGIAATLPRDGFSHVSITYRTTPPDATLAAVEAQGAAASATRVDFLDEPDVVEAALDEAVRRDGPFDTLVHAVGPLVVGRFTDATLEAYREAFDGNVRSAVLAARAVLPAMRERRFGRVVFFGMLGSAQTRPFRSLALYQAAKSALVAFARTLALEEAPHGVTVNVVAPGDVREKSLDRAQATQRAAGNPRGRPGSYEDVADAVRFFVAQERDFITGAVIEVTGGLQTASERVPQDKRTFGS